MSMRGFEDWLEDYRRQVHEAAQPFTRSVADSLLTTIVEDWPGRDRADVHVYARDRSKRAWQVDQDGDGVTITNTATKKGVAYSGYVEQGYTRSGKGTARSYSTRGRKPYAETAAQRVIEQVVDRHARNRFGGR